MVTFAEEIFTRTVLLVFGLSGSVKGRRGERLHLQWTVSLSSLEARTATLRRIMKTEHTIVVPVVGES